MTTSLRYLWITTLFVLTLAVCSFSSIPYWSHSTELSIVVFLGRFAISMLLAIGIVFVVFLARYFLGRGKGAGFYLLLILAISLIISMMLTLAGLSNPMPDRMLPLFMN